MHQHDHVHPPYCTPLTAPLQRYNQRATTCSHLLAPRLRLLAVLLTERLALALNVQVRHGATRLGGVGV